MAEAVIVHDPDKCAGTPCAWHNPSDHHMVDWPRNIRFDRPDMLTERICEHGVGHPDPDSLAYLEGMTGETWHGVHGCCGCCRG